MALPARCSSVTIGHFPPRFAFGALPSISQDPSFQLAKIVWRTSRKCRNIPGTNGTPFNRCYSSPVRHYHGWLCRRHWLCARSAKRDRTGNRSRSRQPPASSGQTEAVERESMKSPMAIVASYRPSAIALRSHAFPVVLEAAKKVRAPYVSCAPRTAITTCRSREKRKKKKPI